MEPDKRYLMVGVFVIALTLSMMGFLVWLVGNQSQGNYDTYQTFVSDSVNGLSVGAAVRYRGVDVGKVNHIEISRSNPAKIRVEMKILDTTPLTTSTVAVLQLQGITGISFVELRGKVAKGQPKITLKGSNKIPIIPAAPSEFRQIVDTIPAMLQKFTELADRLGGFASDQNQQSFATILTNMETFSNQVGSPNENGKTLIDELRIATQQLGEAAAGIQSIATDSKEDTKRILEKTLQTMDRLDKLVNNADGYSKRGYQDLSGFIIEMKKTARDMQNLSNALKQNPSQLIFPSKQDDVKAPR